MSDEELSVLLDAAAAALSCPWAVSLEETEQIVNELLDEARQRLPLAEVAPECVDATRGITENRGRFYVTGFTCVIDGDTPVYLPKLWVTMPGKD